MTRYCRAPAIHARAIGEDTFLVDENEDAIYHLNALGGALWTALETPLGLSDTVQLFAQAFPDQDKAVLTRDLKALLDELAERDLIEAET